MREDFKGARVAAVSNNMKKVLIVVNTSKENSRAVALSVSAYLSGRGIESCFLDFDGFTSGFDAEGYDFVITLGGDGTVLFAARSCVAAGIPVFPVNFGDFGFISSVQPDEWRSHLDDFLSGAAPVAERTMLRATLVRNGAVAAELTGLNDVVISAERAARTVSLDVEYNSLHLCSLKADGLIFCTATGSTAYSASAGGPIIDPELDAVVMTPVNPFSLSSRPIVLAHDGGLKVTVLPCRTRNICMTVDGQEPVPLFQGDVIRIRRTERKVQLVFCTAGRFYTALRSKLNWSGGPHA